MRQWKECDPRPPGGSRTYTFRSCCRGLPSRISASWCRCRIIILIAASTRLISRRKAFIPTLHQRPSSEKNRLFKTHTHTHTRTKSSVFHFYFVSFGLFVCFLLYGFYSHHNDARVTGRSCINCKFSSKLAPLAQRRTTIFQMRRGRDSIELATLATKIPN